MDQFENLTANLAFTPGNIVIMSTIRSGVQNVVGEATLLMAVAARRLLSVTRVARWGTSTRCAAITRNRHSPGTARNKP